jgi:hypothetical protein
MSFVAGAFLLEMLPDEAGAFACFTAAVRDCLPGYYAPTMTALMVDQEVRGGGGGRVQGQLGGPARGTALQAPGDCGGQPPGAAREDARAPGTLAAAAFPTLPPPPARPP